MENKQELAVKQAAEIAKIAADALDSKKGLDVNVLAVGKQTVLADYFVIATGTSSTHVKALADEAELSRRRRATFAVT